jgi:hypothetical protein
LTVNVTIGLLPGLDVRALAARDLLLLFFIAGRRGRIIAQNGCLRQSIYGLPADARRAPSPPAVVMAVTAKAAKPAIDDRKIDPAATVSTWRRGATLRMIGAG